MQLLRTVAGGGAGDGGGGNDAGLRLPTLVGDLARWSSLMRVIIVDDTSLYRLSLADALAGDPSINAVETAADAGTAIDLLAGAAAGTVVLFNMSMPGGVAVLHTIVRAVPTVPVIALAVSDLEHEIIACAEAGVAGCLLKTDSYADLVAMIMSVARGETRCSPPVAAALLRRVATFSRGSRVDPVEIRLTAREIEVMQLVEEGLSNKQIARRLSIELRTVKNHVHHILAKYQVHRRGDAVALFRAGGTPGRARRSAIDTDLVAAPVT
jgi:two-component system nitrate/nitrite response regulator NarL